MQLECSERLYDGSALLPLADYIRRWTLKYIHSAQDDQREAKLLAVADRVQALADGHAPIDLPGELDDVATCLGSLSFHVPSELHRAVLLRRIYNGGCATGVARSRVRDV